MNSNRLLVVTSVAALVVSLLALAWVVYLAPPQRMPPAVQASKVEPDVATMSELDSLEGRVVELEDATGADDVQASVEEVQASVVDVEARVTELEGADVEFQLSQLESRVSELEGLVSELEGRVDQVCVEFGC